MTINRYSHSVPPPAPELAARLRPPRVLGPTAGEASAACDAGAASGTGAVAVESVVLPLVDGLLSEPPDGELLNADRLLGHGDGLADPLSPDPAPTLGPESDVLPLAAVVSLGVAPMMVSSAGVESSDDSLTEVTEARQRM